MSCRQCSAAIPIMRAVQWNDRWRGRATVRLAVLDCHASRPLGMGWRPGAGWPGMPIDARLLAMVKRLSVRAVVRPIVAASVSMTVQALLVPSLEGLIGQQLS